MCGVPVPVPTRGADGARCSRRRQGRPPASTRLARTRLASQVQPTRSTGADGGSMDTGAIRANLSQATQVVSIHGTYEALSATPRQTR
eukprot:6205513-Pleurochrysis_carterae.AAC.1